MRACCAHRERKRPLGPGLYNSSMQQVSHAVASPDLSSLPTPKKARGPFTSPRGLPLAQDTVSKAQHALLVFDLLFDRERTMPGPKPVDLDRLAEGFHFGEGVSDLLISYQRHRPNS
jgi:hypothetical protein